MTVSGPFPPNWPAGCPPVDAEATAGTVYRIVGHSPPEDGDFLSYDELDKPYSDFKGYGLSMYRNREYVIHHQQKYSWLGEFIAVAMLDATYGKVSLVRNIKTTHITVWPFVDVDRKAPFAILELPNAPG